MTNDKFYTHEQIGEIEANTLVHNKSALGENVDELVEQGKATKVNLEGYESLASEADSRHNRYLNAKAKLENSDNPIYEDKRILDYEINELYKEYLSDVEDIQERYKEYKDNAMKSAKEQKARQQGVKVSEADKSVAKSLVDKYAIELMTHSQSREGEVINRLIDDIQHLAPAEREAMVEKLPTFLQSVDSTTERQKVASAVRGNTQADNAIKIAQQLPLSCTDKFDRYRIITSRQGERKY